MGFRAVLRLAFQDRPIHCWSAPIRATFQAGPLTVALLPHGEFQRLPEPTDRAVVKHYLTPKNCEQKLITLRELAVIA